MASNKRGAKRKPELDLEAERSAYGSFVAAANAVSALYTAGVREQRRTAKATLEKVLAFVLRESPNSEYIPKAALIQWLQQEYERADHPDAVVVPGSAPGVLPFMMSAASAASSGDEGAENDHIGSGGGGKLPRGSSGSGRVRVSACGAEDMHQQQHHQQQQQQQQLPYLQQAAAAAQQQQFGPAAQQPGSQQQFGGGQQFHLQTYHTQQSFQQQQQQQMDTGHHPSFPPHFA
ncbi:hypothetical protein Rsub_05891 [Raphidocelis subcapitata]|uniref:Uncharacterized protein n=1 Tax=Raphidocelis subcapitata TaxID=307507 RepID=A0A2V0P5M1_9CHLO|nr:hypothetical protein Rsub_05891 [Raphidocelis subcapitata]|eukprot:GBF93160.1 hypothetical protein Rsub_05891 [Raphidocelis subcapitata]